MIRSKNGKLIVEVYDPATQKKVYVKPSDHGMTAPRSMREARALERLALSTVEARARRQPAGDETVGSFLLDPWSQDGDRGRGRWTRDYANKRGESTIVHNSERVRRFAEQHRDRTLRSITRTEARRQAADHEGTVPALRAAWSDAKRDGLVDENVFAGLGIERRRGREDIVPLLMEEVHRLAEIATELNGTGPFGQEVCAAILWAAYTMCRPGETFAARRSLLDGDTYHLHTQMNSTLGRETAPKHGGRGAIYVPEPAVQVIESLPPRLQDDLLFHTKTGRQFRQESWWRTWDPIRTQFARELPAGHHLRQRLDQDPDDKLDFHELRHMGASYALNVLEIEPWVIAKQLRHSDDGALVIKLYGHPTREAAVDRLRRGWGANVRELPVKRQPTHDSIQRIVDEP